MKIEYQSETDGASTGYQKFHDLPENFDICIPVSLSHKDIADMKDYLSTMHRYLEF